MLLHIGHVSQTLLICFCLVCDSNGFPNQLTIRQNLLYDVNEHIILIVHGAFLPRHLSDGAKEASPRGSPVEKGTNCEVGCNAPLTLPP